jgi:hypothetical protein
MKVRRESVQTRSETGTRRSGTAPQTGTGTKKKGACPQQYVDVLNGETARRSRVSALTAEAS